MRIAFLTPSNSSLYARVAAKALSSNEKIEIVGIMARKVWNWKRIRNEIRRDGARLVRKLYVKLIARDWGTDSNQSHTLSHYAIEQGVTEKKLSELAKQQNISFAQVQDFNDSKSLEILRSWNVDLLIFTGGGLLRKDLLAIPTQGTLNCHMGILPRYRGMDVVEWPVLETDNSKPEIGITVHFMDQGIDTGPILRALPISPMSNETREAMRARMEISMAKLMTNVVEDLAANRITPQTQEKSAGLQYFVMHPRLMELAEKKLHTFAKK